MLLLALSKKADLLFLGEYLNFLLGLNMSQWKTVVRFPILLYLVYKLGLWLTKSAIKSLLNDVSRGRFTSHFHYCRSILRCQRHEMI